MVPVLSIWRKLVKGNGVPPPSGTSIVSSLLRYLFPVPFRKGNYVFCFLVFICFHPRVSLLVSFPSQAVHDPPATTTLHLSGCSSSCLGFCQRATPLVSILAGQICNLGTWQASQGQCHLSTPLCLAFYSSPPSQDKDLPPGQPVPLPRA